MGPTRPATPGGEPSSWTQGRATGAAWRVRKASSSRRATRSYSIRPPRPQHRTAHDRHLQIHLQLLGLRLGLLTSQTLFALGQATLRVRQCLAAGLWVAQRLGQLIPAILAVELVLTAVGVLGFAQDVFDQPAVAAVLIHRRVRLDLRPIDRDHPNRHQGRLPTQTKHLVKQPRDLRFMTPAELRDRRMVRAAHPRDHLERHVFPTRPLDPPRGPNPARVRVEQRRHHITAGSNGARPAAPADTAQRSSRGPSDRQHRAPSRPDDPQAATRPTTAASTTTDHGQPQRILEPCQKCLKPTRQHRYSDSLATEDASAGGRADHRVAAKHSSRAAPANGPSVAIGIRPVAQRQSHKQSWASCAVSMGSNRGRRTPAVRGILPDTSQFLLGSSSCVGPATGSSAAGDGC